MKNQRPVGSFLPKLGRFTGNGLHALRRRRKIVKAQRQKRRHRAALVQGTAPIQKVRGRRNGNQSKTIRGAENRGRLGEAAAHQYLVEKLGSKNVIWMNQNTEFGLTYDIVIRNRSVTQYVEVKATVFPDKHWFHISRNEWRFASEKGDAFIIAYVLLSGRDKASIAFLKNPHNLCRRKDLKLALVMSDELEEVISEHLEEIALVMSDELPRFKGQDGVA